MNPGKNKQGSQRESVWDYPRPPRIEDFERPIQVIFAGTTIADTHRAKRVLETSHPPCYYIPPSDVMMDHLIHTSRSTWCEWKGKATYYSVRVGDRIAENAAWAYLKPTPAFEPIQGWVTFIASSLCLPGYSQIMGTLCSHLTRAHHLPAFLTSVTVPWATRGGLHDLP